MLPDKRQMQEALAEASKVHEGLDKEVIQDMASNYAETGDMETKVTLIDWVFALACARVGIILTACQNSPRHFTPGAISIVTGEAGEVAYLGQHVISTFDQGSLDSPEGFWEKVEGLTLDLLGYNDKVAPFNSEALGGNVPLALWSQCCSALEGLGLDVDSECDHKDGEAFIKLPDGREYTFRSSGIEEAD